MNLTQTTSRKAILSYSATDTTTRFALAAEIPNSDTSLVGILLILAGIVILASAFR